MVNIDKVKLVAIRVIERSKTKEELLINLRAQADWVYHNLNNIEVEYV